MNYHDQDDRQHERQPIGEFGLLLAIFKLLAEFESISGFHVQDALTAAAVRIRAEGSDLDWRNKHDVGFLTIGIVREIAGLTKCDEWLVTEAARVTMLQSRARIVLEEMQAYKAANLTGRSPRKVG